MKLSIAAFPDIHGFMKNIKAMRKKLSEVDVILLVGDMTNGRISTLYEIVDYMSTYCENVLAVCGNHDSQEMEDYLNGQGKSLHAKHKIINDIAFVGCGGALPFVGNYEFGEDEYEIILEQSIEGLSPNLPKVLISHQPPYGTKLDSTYLGQHVGSHAIRKFIEQEQPLLCFTGHIHEARGIDNIGQTHIINAGMIEGSNHFAYAEIENGTVTVLERRKANPHG